MLIVQSAKARGNWNYSISIRSGLIPVYRGQTEILQQRPIRQLAMGVKGREDRASDQYPHSSTHVASTGASGLRLQEC